MKANDLFEKLGYSKSIIDNEEIYYREVNYGNEERIIFDLLNKKVYKKTFIFPRIDITKPTKHENEAIKLRQKELDW